MHLQLLALQINAEKYYFGIRKSLVEFDEVLEVCIIYSLDHCFCIFPFDCLYFIFMLLIKFSIQGSKLNSYRLDRGDSLHHTWM